MSFISELKRRHVLQSGIAYLVLAWGAAQVAELILDAYEAQPWVMQMILALLGLGFPVVILFSWFFDLRWDGLHREIDFAAGDLKSELEPKAVEHKSIAVLPFVNMSSDQEQEHFSDGISEELLNVLASIPNLRVAARTSSFSFKGKNTDITEIGRILNVAHVLEGSVRRSGDLVRITAQLIQSANGYHLWSKTWDRDLKDIFAVQDEIAGEVAEQLKLTLIESRRTGAEPDPEAYALFLQARSLFRQHTEAAFDDAIELLDEGGESLLTYAPAWALRSDVYSSQANFGFRSTDEGYSMAREAAQRALSLDPNCIGAICSLGRIAMDYDQDLAAAADHFERAFAIDPTDPILLGRSANLCGALNKLGLAIELLNYLIVQDPVNPALHNNLGACYYFALQPEDAISSCRAALRLSPGRIGMHYVIAMAYLMLDDVTAAMIESEQEEYAGFSLTVKALCYYAMGQMEEADSALAKLIEDEAHEFAYNIGFVLACRGDMDRAFEWLERAREYHDGGLSMINSEPSFNVLHNDPRWQEFLAKIGKSEPQLSAVDFDVKVPTNKR